MVQFVTQIKLTIFGVLAILPPWEAWKSECLEVTFHKTPKSVAMIQFWKALSPPQPKHLLKPIPN